jgi:hypothetical protein
MGNPKLTYLLFLVAFFGFNLSYTFGQDSLKSTAFIKGRNIVALNGSISSATNNRFSGASNDERILNNYSLNARLAKVVANNYALGLQLGTERYSTQQLAQIDVEILAIGPWSSYYFITAGQSGGLFLQGAVQFINYFEQSYIGSALPPLNEEISGMGFAGTLGVGFNYVVFNCVGLEVSMNYRSGRIYANVENFTASQSGNVAFTRSDIEFRYGFIVLFDRIRK